MLASASRSRPGPRARARAGFRSSKAGAARTLVKRDASSADRNDNDIDDENEHHPTMPRTTHVVCMSFDTLVDATDEMCLVGHEAARRFWPKKIPGTPAEYADVFRMLMPCLEESSSFEGALMVRVMAEENIAERTRFRLMLKRRKAERLKAEAAERAAMERAVTAKQRERFEREAIAPSRRAGCATRGVQTRDGPDDRGTHHASAEPEGGGGGVGRDQAPREHEVRVRFADGRRVGGSDGAARGVAERGERGAGGVRGRDRDAVQGRHRGRRRGGGVGGVGADRGRDGRGARRRSRRRRVDPEAALARQSQAPPRRG